MSVSCQGGECVELAASVLHASPFRMVPCTAGKELTQKKAEKLRTTLSTCVCFHMLSASRSTKNTTCNES